MLINFIYPHLNSLETEIVQVTKAARTGSS
jgi:hypothetical protein